MTLISLNFGLNCTNQSFSLSLFSTSTNYFFRQMYMWFHPLRPIRNLKKRKYKGWLYILAAFDHQHLSSKIKFVRRDSWNVISWYVFWEKTLIKKYANVNEDVPRLLLPHIGIIRCHINSIETKPRCSFLLEATQQSVSLMVWELNLLSHNQANYF